MHISFDFDYTLADSSKGAIECTNYALKKLGYPQKTSQEIKKTIGLNLESTYKQLVDSSHSKKVKEFESLFLQKADEVVVKNIEFYSTTKTVLQTLKQEGHYLSIVSTKYTKRIIEALKRDGLYGDIDCVVGGDKVNQSKPSPEGLILAMEYSGISKSNTIYIGDSKSDGKAALNAGIGFVGVLTGVTKLMELEQFEPIAVLDNLEKLPSLVNQFLIEV